MNQNTIKLNYSRRSFIQVSSAVGGGLLLGFNFLTGCTEKEIEEKIDQLEMPKDWYKMNGYVKIGENGLVTIISPNPEIGQNVKTSMPMIVAEELDVDWNKVVVEQGAYNEQFEWQLAGGSGSIRVGWKNLRTAGATARRMLMEVAAKNLEVPFNELTTALGTIFHKKSNRSISYGEVAADAANIEIPEEISLKDPKDWKIIGTSRKNVDGKAIVTGQAIFGMDYKEEGMLIAMIEHAPSFGMTLSSFNQEEIKQMAGIVDAFALNIPYQNRPWFDDKAIKKKSMIAIIGDSTWQLMKAKKALKAEWDRESKAEGSAEHETQLLALIEKGGKEKRRDGNPELAFSKAERIIERTYSAPYLPHVTMSPMNFFADVKEDSIRLVGPIQSPDGSAKMIAEMFNVPLENVDLQLTRMGGGFGRRLSGNFVVEAAFISKNIGKPIKLIYTREDDMTNDAYRPIYKVRYKAGFDEENNFVAFQVTGAGSQDDVVFGNRFPAGAIDHYLAQDNIMLSNIATGMWRAPSSNFIAFAEQAFLDEVAESVQHDPLDFRLKLFERAIKHPVGEKNDYNPERYANVLKLVKEKSNWGEESVNIYRGIAAYYCHKTYVAQVVDLEKNDGQINIKKVWCAVDCGIVVNPDAAKNMIEGGIIDGIGAAMYGGMTFKNGIPNKKNFDTYRMIRISEAPDEIEIHFVKSDIDPSGLGEPSLPPVIGALANALYKATGKRYYKQPFTET